jgi:hypothetical protein
VKPILLALGCVWMIAGCAVSKDGIGLAHRPPDATKVAAVRDQLQQNANASPTANSRTDEPSATEKHPGILAIGTTGPLRNIEGKDRASFYAGYLKAAEKWHPGATAALSEAEFQQKLAGWASVQISGIPGIVSTRIRVLVPAALAQDTRFASAAGSFLVGTTGDLVAARGDVDGLLWLDRVLCQDDSTYHACAQDYEKGIFDENTGQELDRDRKPKANGRVVNVASYRKT